MTLELVLNLAAEILILLAEKLPLAGVDGFLLAWELIHGAERFRRRERQRSRTRKG